MMKDYAQPLAAQFGLETWQTAAVITLLDEGNTIPFIARYRKEAHGSLDDQKIRLPTRVPHWNSTPSALNCSTCASTTESGRR